MIRKGRVKELWKRTSRLNTWIKRIYEEHVAGPSQSDKRLGEMIVQCMGIDSDRMAD